MKTFRKTLTACLAELEPEQILDVMGYVKSRPRYLWRLQHWVCLRAYDLACARERLDGRRLAVEQCRAAAADMLARRQASRWAGPLTQIIEGGYIQIGTLRWPYDWNGPRLNVAGHQFNVRELLASKPQPVAAALSQQLDLFRVAA